MKQWKLRTQLSAGFLLIALATVAAVSLLANLLIARQFSAYVSAQQKSFADRIAAGLSYPYDAASGRWNAEYIHGVGMYAMADGYFIRVYGADGALVWDAESHDMAACSAIRTEMQAEMARLGRTGEGGFLTAEYPLAQDGQAVGRAEISYYSPYYYNENAFRFVDALNRILLWVGLAALAGAAVAGWFFARRIGRPVSCTAEAARQISAGNYAVRVGAAGPAWELAELSAAVDQMAAILEQQERLRRRLTTDVAHELRTPLATVSAHLEAMEEGVWEPTPERLGGCREEIVRLTGLVSDLQRLSQTEAESLRLEKEPVALAALARSVCGGFAAQLREAGLACRVEGQAATVQADPGRLRQVMTNLVSNAVKYSEPGGEVVVRVGETADTAFFSVTDTGIGIPPEDQTWIFERFYRTDASRSRKTGGTGVGLTISRAIVRAHGGEIAVRSEPGRGSCFTVTLPRETKGKNE